MNVDRFLEIVTSNDADVVVLDNGLKRSYECYMNIVTNELVIELEMLSECTVDEPISKCDLEDEISALLNKHSKENDSNTPDFILSRYLLGCLEAFNRATNERSKWYGEVTPSTTKL